MSWWNSLTFEEKYFKMAKHKKEIIGYPCTPESLTGYEIEKIYKNEKDIPKD